MTPRQLRAEAAKARESARRLLEYAETCDRAAEASEALQARNGYDRLGGMDATTVTPKRDHRGPDALSGPVADLARACGVTTLQAVARLLEEPYDTVRVWNHRQKFPARVQGKVEALRRQHS